MKISYILQLKDFFIIFGIGFLMGILYGIINAPNLIKKRLPFRIIVDLIFTMICSIIFIISINLVNLGEFRFFLIIGYLLGILLERITLGKLFAKGYKIVYNSIVNLFKRFANSGLGKVIFK